MSTPIDLGQKLPPDSPALMQADAGQLLGRSVEGSVSKHTSIALANKTSSKYHTYREQVARAAHQVVHQLDWHAGLPDVLIRRRLSNGTSDLINALQGNQCPEESLAQINLQAS